MTSDSDLERGVSPEVVQKSEKNANEQTPPIHDVSDTESTPRERPFSANTIVSDPINKYVVDWENATDPENPINWTKQKKWKNLTIVSLVTLIT